MGENSFLQALRTTQSCPGLTPPALEDSPCPPLPPRGRGGAVGGKCLVQRCCMLVKPSFGQELSSPSPIHPAPLPAGPVLHPSWHLKCISSLPDTIPAPTSALDSSRPPLPLCLLPQPWVQPSGRVLADKAPNLPLPSPTLCSRLSCAPRTPPLSPSTHNLPN